MYRDEQQRNFARELRNHPQIAERALWRFLRAEQLGVKFRRQSAIGPYVVDFVCFERGLIVELDGPQHREPAARNADRRRTAWLESQGFRIIRFRNHELDWDMRDVLRKIEQTVEARQSKNAWAGSRRTLNPLPDPPHKGAGEERSKPEGK